MGLFLAREALALEFVFLVGQDENLGCIGGHGLVTEDIGRKRETGNRAWSAWCGMYCTYLSRRTASIRRDKVDN